MLRRSEQHLDEGWEANLSFHKKTQPEPDGRDTLCWYGRLHVQKIDVIGVQRYQIARAIFP